MLYGVGALVFFMHGALVGRRAGRLELVALDIFDIGGDCKVPGSSVALFVCVRGPKICFGLFVCIVHVHCFGLYLSSLWTSLYVCLALGPEIKYPVSPKKNTHFSKFFFAH